MKRKKLTLEQNKKNVDGQRNKGICEVSKFSVCERCVKVVMRYSVNRSRVDK